MREYWFEIPPRHSDESSQQVGIRANTAMEMLDFLKQYDNWQEALFLGFHSPPDNKAHKDSIEINL